MALRHGSVDALRRAYQFTDLQSFLDIYYQGAAVLLRERDFYEITMAYLRRAAADNVRHAEIFFDRQTHTRRGIAFATVIDGISAALRAGPISSRLILCFLRHLSAESAMQTLEAALPYRDRIVAVGLDSAEAGNPPSKFAAVFARARQEGFLTVAHAGEEAGPSYIGEALALLRVSRIDHGVRCFEDPALVDDLVARRIPLTVCPLSNVKLGIFRSIQDHPLRTMLQRGIVATVNSDDPAYFGGYVVDNYLAVASALGLQEAEVRTLARNSFEASFLPDEEKKAYLRDVERA